MGCLHRKGSYRRGYSFPDIRQVMWRDKVYDKWLSSKFSGQLKGNIENLLNETEVSIYKKYGITYSKLRVKRDGYYLLISTKPDKPFDIWEP